jgi:Zn-finger nucleic acid-binding protein
MTPFDCPRCGAALSMSERQGIEIDYCPQCRGVWLDRGELDKIVERAALESPPPQPAGGWTRPSAPPAEQPGTWNPRQWLGDDDDAQYRRRYQEGKRRKHWLHELFD